MRRFFKANGNPAVYAEQLGPIRGLIGERFHFALTVESDYPRLPGSYSARFGDAIHNYRCALDHIAWQLVRHGKTPKPPQENRVQFPIYREETAFRRRQGERLPGVAA